MSVQGLLLPPFDPPFLPRFIPLTPVRCVCERETEWEGEGGGVNACTGGVLVHACLGACVSWRLTSVAPSLELACKQGDSRLKTQDSRLMYASPVCVSRKTQDSRLKTEGCIRPNPSSTLNAARSASVYCTSCAHATTPAAAASVPHEYHHVCAASPVSRLPMYASAVCVSPMSPLPIYVCLLYQCMYISSTNVCMSPLPMNASPLPK